MKFVFTDRESAYPNRYLVTPESGTPYHAVLTRADEPVVVGTPLNAETFNAMMEGMAESAGTVTEIDFTNFENGSFTEVVDGVTITHTTEFDENGNLVAIDGVAIELGDTMEEYAPIDHNHDGKYSFGQEFEFDSGDINAATFTYAGNKAHMYNILLVPGAAYLGGFPVTIDWGFLPDDSSGEWGNFWVHTGDDLVSIKAWKDSEGYPHFEAPSGFLFRRIRGYY
jgi:hypothetical protein